MVGSQLRKPCDQVNKVTVKRMRLFVNSCESLERALKRQAKHCGRKISNHSAGAEDSVVRDRAGESEATLQSFVNFLHASLDMECTTMMFNIRKHLDQKQWTQAVRAITCDSSTELSGPAKQLYVYHTANSTDMVDLLIQTAFSGSLRLTLASNWARAAHRKRWVQPLQHIAHSRVRPPAVISLKHASQRHSRDVFPQIFARALGRSSAA